MTYVLLPGAPKWSIGTITWSIAVKNYGNEFDVYGVTRPFSSFMNLDQSLHFRAMINAAFAQWAAVCNLVFKEVADTADVGIRFGFVYIGSSGASAWCAHRFDGAKRMIQALIQVDEADWGAIDWDRADPAYVRVMTGLMAHEIGHALGFDHNQENSIMNPGTGVMADMDRAGAAALYGMPQSVVVIGGRSVVVGCGHDQVAGDAEANQILLGAGNDYATTGDGNDTVDGGGGFDQINTGAGDDMARGGSESDQIAGGPGADTLDGGPGADWIAGGPGPDTFTIRKGESDRDWIADFEPGVDKLNIEGGPVQLIKNGNGTYTLRWDDGHEELLVAGNLSA